MTWQFVNDGTVGHMGDEPERSEPTPEELEEFVAAALRVDPKGLSGKHKSKPEKGVTDLPGGNRQKEKE